MYIARIRLWRGAIGGRAVQYLLLECNGKSGVEWNGKQSKEAHAVELLDGAVAIGDGLLCARRRRHVRLQ